MSMGHRERRGPLDVRMGWLIILAFVIQWVAIPNMTDPSALALKKAVLALTALMILVGIVPNLRWWAFRVLALAFVLNTLVISVNGGLMPITPEKFSKLTHTDVADLTLGQTPPHSKNVLLRASDTRLAFLSDVFPISAPRAKVYSIGDLILRAGLVMFILEAVVRAVQSRKRPKPSNVGQVATNIETGSV